MPGIMKTVPSRARQAIRVAVRCNFAFRNHFGPVAILPANWSSSSDMPVKPRWQGLIAVASRGGSVKVFGAPGVELVLEEKDSALDEPPAYLVFPTPGFLVGVTSAASLVVWNLSNGTICGHLEPPSDPSAPDDTVTAVHSPCGTDRAEDVEHAAGAERYVYLGLESGSVRVVQVLPVCRVSGYALEPRDLGFGAPQELLSPSGDEGLGAVTAITSSGEGDGGALGLIGFRYGAIVLWDWVRRKRLALHGIPESALCDEDGGEREDGEPGDREVTTLAFHPSREAFAAGFALGCYAVFPASASRDRAQPRWVAEVGDDGSCKREGPTIVRTPVSLVKWVGVRQGERESYGLVVAGGVEIEEGEDPDGASLLIPSSGHEDGPPGLLAGGGARAKRQSGAASALSPLETAVFVPFAVGQERLSCLHAEPLPAGDDPETVDTWRGGSGVGWKSSGPRTDAGVDGTPGSGGVAGSGVDEGRKLVVFGLVEWTEEVQGEDGRLHFRHVSSVKACPVQTAPHVALLQLAPERLGPHLMGLPPVTMVASTPLLSSSTILNFATCLGAAQAEESGGKGRVASLLRGGILRWAESVPPARRDEALGTVEMLVVGHSDGSLSFWECCGPTLRSDGVCVADGRVCMYEIPSGATLLGTLPAAGLTCGEGVTTAVTALDVWVEREHVATAERDACWVAVGFESGDAAVLVLTNRLRAAADGSRRGGGGGWGGGTPLTDTPKSISNVEIGDAPDRNDQAGQGWKKFMGGGGQREEDGGDDVEDSELDDAIAAARAEAEAIQAQDGGSPDGESGDGDSGAQPEGQAGVHGGTGSDAGQASESERDAGTGSRERESGSDPKIEEAARQDPSPPLPSASTGIDKEDGGMEANNGGKAGKPAASLLQLALRLHGHGVRRVALSFDSSASSLAVVVADAQGVVSVTDIATGSASLLPMRAPQVRPCYPAITIGPFPAALGAGDGARRRAQQSPKHGAAGALFVFLEGWLNIFDLATRDPIDVVEVPGLGLESESDGIGQSQADASSPMGWPRRRGSRGSDETDSWVFCVDEQGVPIVPYASEPPSSLAPSSSMGEDLEQDTPQGSSDGRSGGGGEGAAADGPRARDRVQTIWVSPFVSRTALDGCHERELQVLSGPSAPPSSALVVARGGSVAVVAITRRDSAVASFSRRSVAGAQEVALFKAKPGAQLVVRARASSAVDGSAVSPRIDSVGVCLVAAGAGDFGTTPTRRGCLVTTDVSGFVKAFLLPSLAPVFGDKLPAADKVSGWVTRSAALSRKFGCNLVGELTVASAPQVS